MAKIYRVIEIKNESVGLRKCPYDHWLTNKAYLSTTTVTDIYQSFTYKMSAKINWHRHGTKLRHLHPMYNQPVFDSDHCLFQLASNKLCVIPHRQKLALVTETLVLLVAVMCRIKECCCASPEHTIAGISPGWVDPDVDWLYISIDPPSQVVHAHPQGLFQSLGSCSKAPMIYLWSCLWSSHAACPKM